MLRSVARALIPCFCLLSLCALAQENRVRVCVPTMKNSAGRSIPGTLERDRLVTDLNQQKPDKKTHLGIQGVSLDGSSPDELGDQIKDKKCDYIVYTNLVELRLSSDPMMRQTPGTIQTNPSVNPMGRAPGSLNQTYEATAEYKLYRAGGMTAISGASFSIDQGVSEDAAVSQLMDRIASKVSAEVKKGGLPPMQE